MGYEYFSSLLLFSTKIAGMYVKKTGQEGAIFLSKFSRGYVYSLTYVYSGL